MSARNLAEAAVLALAALIVAWHGWLAPPVRIPAAIAIALHLAPVMPALWLVARRDRRAAFFGALGALLLFSHGVAEAWASPATRHLAWTEISLSLAIVAGASWDGLRARFAKSRRV